LLSVRAFLLRLLPFASTYKSADKSFLPPEPDFRGENGRKYRVYRMDQQLPV
jgi:hypothetical protein